MFDYFLPILLWFLFFFFMYCPLYNLHVSQFFFSFFTFNKETKKSTLENASTASKFKSYAPIFKEKKMRKERNYNLSYTEARAKELPYILTVDSNRNPSVLPTNNIQDTWRHINLQWVYKILLKISVIHHSIQFFFGGGSLYFILLTWTMSWIILSILIPYFQF